MKRPQVNRRMDARRLHTRRQFRHSLLVVAAFFFAAGLVQNLLAVQQRNRLLAQAVVEREQRLTWLRRQHQELLAVKAYLQSDGGIVAAARPLGYGLTGEQRIMFDQPAPAEAIAAGWVDPQSAETTGAVTDTASTTSQWY